MVAKKNSRPSNRLKNSYFVYCFVFVKIPSDLFIPFYDHFLGVNLTTSNSSVIRVKHINDLASSRVSRCTKDGKCCVGYGEGNTNYADLREFLCNLCNNNEVFLNYCIITLNHTRIKSVNKERRLFLASP
jgi:hypothetical protein